MTYRVPLYTISLVRDSSIPADTKRVTTSADAEKVLRAVLGSPDREHFVVLCLDAKNAVIVRAVNSYDTVREALEMARQDLLERPPLYSFDGYLSLLAKVEAALAAGIVKVH